MTTHATTRGLKRLKTQFDFDVGISDMRNPPNQSSASYWTHYNTSWKKHRTGQLIRQQHFAPSMSFHIGNANTSTPREPFIPNSKLKLLDQVSEVMRFKKHYS